MSYICQRLHQLSHSKKLYTFPFNTKEIPSNGVYILFEKDEEGYGGQRIVRVGTHTGNNQLPSRLKQHFLNENKDRSIFRKNIGRCLLSAKNDPYLEIWELDLTSRKMKDQYQHLVNKAYQEQIEREVTSYIQDNFSFCLIEVNDKENRLQLESKIISTVSLCKECGPSTSWLGLHSPKDKIIESGLWLVNQLYKEPLSKEDLAVHF